MEAALADKIADDPESWKTFSAGLFYEPVDLQKSDDLVRLGKRLEQIDRQRATRSNRTFYLSVSPAFYGSGCRALAGAGLLADPKRSRVVIEKPFGRDYASAPRTSTGWSKAADKKPRSFESTTTSAKKPSRTSW